MKKLFKAVGLGMIATTVSIQAISETRTRITNAETTPSVLSQGPKSRITNDAGRVLTAPHMVASNQQAQIRLLPGVYAVSRPGKLFAERLLFVENYQNKENSFLIIQIDRTSLDAGKSSGGKMYIGTLMNGGTAVKLAPLFLDNHTGLPLNAAKLNSSAPITKITDTAGDDRMRYPYSLQGFNGSQGGELWAMRRIENSKYSLTLKPNATMFSVGSRGSDITVDGSQVTINVPGRRQELQFISQLGTGDGAISFMNAGKYNSMTDRITVGSKIQKFAFVLSIDYPGSPKTDSQDGTSLTQEQFFVTVAPTNGYDFRFDFYGKKRRSLWDILLPGQR